MGMLILLLVLLIALAALPAWPYSSNWGIVPSVLAGLVLLLVGTFLLLGKLN